MGQSFPRAANIIHQASEIINLFGGQLKNNRIGSHESKNSAQTACEWRLEAPISDYDVCSLTIFVDNNVKFVDNIGCRLEAITFRTS